MNGLLLLCLVLLLSGCSSKPYALQHTLENSREESQAIYVVNHGWHTGIVVPAGKIQSKLPQLRERFANTAYIEFGWGDNLFYPAKETTTALTLRALFWPTRSVIHAVAVGEKVALFFPGCQVEKLCLDGNGYSLLIRFITNSFYKNKKNDIVTLNDGIYGNSQFYQGDGLFYFMNTCNVWTAKGLQSAGLNISPSFKITADSVMNYIENHNQELKIAPDRQAGPASPCP
jgi:uncharacterized protein (TIGR02117 family)